MAADTALGHEAAGPFNPTCKHTWMVHRDCGAWVEQRCARCPAVRTVLASSADATQVPRFWP